MSVLLWIYYIVIVCVMRNGITFASDGSEMECFVCNSLLGDLCYDPNDLNFSSFTKNCSDYVEVMPNCVFSEDEIAHGSDARYSEGPVTTSTDEKPADEATSNKVIDGSGTSGNQESVESSKRSNFSDDYPNDVPDYENFAYGTFENYEKTPSEGWKPSTTAIVQHIPSAKNATGKDENSKLIWTKAKNTSTLDKHKGSARGSRLYYCYKLIAISKDGEQFTIRGCTRKAHACFTGNYQAVDHYDCTVCGRSLCNAQSATDIFKSVITLWSIQAILLTTT